jgi:hypothetical protein
MRLRGSSKKKSQNRNPKNEEARESLTAYAKSAVIWPDQPEALAYVLSIDVNDLRRFRTARIDAFLPPSFLRT